MSTDLSEPALRDSLKPMLTAYIGMGANLPSRAGSPETTLAAATERFTSLGRVVCRSSLYSTAPVGLADQPRFVNAIVGLATGLAPRSLLMRLLAIERDFGRDRVASVPNGPRTLDLDILLLGDLCLHEAGLEIPHPRLAARGFVLAPFAEIAPQVVDPRHGKTVAQLLQDLTERHKDEADAVVPIQSDLWRPVPCGGGVKPVAASRAETGEPDPHG